MLRCMYCHDFHIKDIKIRLNIESIFGDHKLKIESLKRALYQRFDTTVEASVDLQHLLKI